MAGIRAQRRERNRKAVLDAGAKIFSKKGYFNSTMKDISQETGLGMGSIYLLFKNKEDLFFTIAYEKFAELVEVTASLDEQKPASADEYLETFHEFLFEFIRYFHKNPSFVKIIMFDRTPLFWGISRKLLKKIRAQFTLIHEKFQNYFELGKKLGAVDSELDSMFLAENLMGLVNTNYFYLHLMKHKTPLVDMQKSIQTIILKGICPEKS